jgi:hypothetical protein
MTSTFNNRACWFWSEDPPEARYGRMYCISAVVYQMQLGTIYEKCAGLVDKFDIWAGHALAKRDRHG